MVTHPTPNYIWLVSLGFSFSGKGKDGGGEWCRAGILILLPRLKVLEEERRTFTRSTRVVGGRARHGRRIKELTTLNCCFCLPLHHPQSDQEASRSHRGT